MSELRARLLAAALLSWAAVALIGCPKPTPTPVNPTPDASDAAQPVPQQPLATAAACQAACTAAQSACSTVDIPTCVGLCSLLPANYADKLAASTGCPGARTADPGASTGQSTGKSHGR